MLLRFLSAVATSPYYVWNKLIAPLVYVGLMASAAIGSITGTLAMVLIGLHVTFLREPLMDIFLVCFAAMAALFMIEVICAWIVALLANVATAHPLGFGREGWRLGWFLRLRVTLEPTDPAATLRLYRLADVRSQVGTKTLLQYFSHSVLLVYPPALGEITGFVSVCGAPQPKGR